MVNICSCGELGSCWQCCVPPSTQDVVTHSVYQMASIVQQNKMF